MICPTCSTWAGPFGDKLLWGHHENCDLNPKNIIYDILHSRQCLVHMDESILKRCELWMQMETT